MHKFIEWAKNIGIVTKAIGGLVLVGGFIGTGLYFYQPRATAQAEHAEIRSDLEMSSDLMYAQAEEARVRLAEYDEMSRLETDIKLTQLQIKQLNGTMERRELTADEATDLELARDTLSLLQERLRNLQAAMREADSV